MQSTITSHSSGVSITDRESGHAPGGRRLAATRQRATTGQNRQRLVRGSLAVSTTLMGLIAGFFYAYACSVMIGLANADDRTFVVAMQEINASVRNAWFAPAFFGSLVVTAVTVALVAASRDRRAFGWTIAGLVLYASAFVITMGVSVPLNNELAEAGHPDNLQDLAAVRNAYESDWVRWNIDRTITSTLALIALIRALMIQSRSPQPE